MLLCVRLRYVFVFHLLSVFIFSLFCFLAFNLDVDACCRCFFHSDMSCTSIYHVFVSSFFFCFENKIIRLFMFSFAFICLFSSGYVFPYFSLLCSLFFFFFSPSCGVSDGIKEEYIVLSFVLKAYVIIVCCR